VTIIDIDTFTLYQESFKAGDIKLNGIIDEYKYIALNPKKKSVLIQQIGEGRKVAPGYLEQ
jgi:hypothetical protein